ncbi:MAG: ABC transporter ATP-binding protein [Novipirellula sp. JB048]
MELLDLVGLAESAEAYPHTLSGGQQQRVALVRALARRPSVMLLDEPFSGLDPRLRDQIRDTTLRVLRQANVATLLVTHDAREALAAGDQVSVLRDGVILQTDSPDRLYSNPIDVHVAEFFGKVNLLTNADGSSTILRPEELQTHCLESHSAARGKDELCRGTVVGVQFEGAMIGYTIKCPVGDCWFVRESAEKPMSPGQVIAIARK